METTKDNEFINGAKAVIVNLDVEELNGVEVIVSGVTTNFSPIYRLYVVSREDGELWSNNYKHFAIPSHYLKPI